MANWTYTSGRYGGGSYGPWLSLYVEEREKDIANNRTKLYMRLRFHWDSNISYSFNSRSGSLYGTSYSYSGSASGSSGYRDLRTQEVWVGHNSDGSKSVGITGNITNLGLSWSGVNIGTMSVSGTPTLTVIPRGSLLNSVNMNNSLQTSIANTVNINVTRYSDNFRHRFQLLDGATVVKTWDNINASGAGGLALSASEVNTLLGRMPNVTSKTFTLRMDTRSGVNGGWIGSAVSRNFTISINANVQPSLSNIAYSQVGNDLTTHILQSISRISASFSRTAGQGATIASSTITVARGSDSQTINSNSGTTSRAVNQSGSYVITYSVRDSRGRTNSTTRTLEVTAYSTPKITKFSVVRDTISQAKVNISEIGTWTALGTSNILTLQIQYREGTSGIWNDLISNRTVSGGSFNNAYSPINLFDVTLSYQFRLIITDSFGNQLTSTINISTQKVLMDWHKGEGVGIGKLHEKGTLDVAGDIYNDGALIGKSMNFSSIYPANQSDTIAFWTSINAGNYYVSSGNLQNQPSTYGLMQVIRYGNDFTAIWYQQGSGRIYRKSGNSNINSLWEVIDAPISGSNSNGHWVRFADGTQICWANTTVVYVSTGRYLERVWNYPILFSGGVTGNLTRANFWGAWRAVSASPSLDIGTDIARLRLWRQEGAGYEFVSGDSLEVRVMAIGRWK